MKRLLTLILCITLVLSSFSFVSSADSADDSYSANAIDVVSKLGLMDKGLTLSPGATMTRGDVIETVINLCGVDVTGGKSVFSDLEPEHVHHDAIMTAHSMGLVNGFSDGTVRPDDPALVSHTMQLIYYALGYKEYGSLTRAVEKANVGTLSDLYSTKEITAAKFADLMVQAGESHPLEVRIVSKENGDRTSEFYNSKQTVLEKYYDISRVEGIVTSAGGMNLDPERNYKSDKVVIGEEILKVDKVKADAFFGQNVVAYYRQYKDLTDKRLVCLYSYNNNVTEITPDTYDGYSDGKIYYKVGDQKYDDIKISFSVVDMFVNNVMVKNPKESYFDIDSGKITLIDNNKDRKFDVIIIVEYETYVVDFINKDHNAIFGKYNDLAIFLDNYEDVSIVAENGDVIYIEELSANDVLSVVKAADGSSISIVYALSEVNGTIEATSEENNNLYVTIDGKEYKVTTDCNKNEGTLFTVGRTGVFPLNATGEISTYIPPGKLASVGYLIKAKQSTGLNEKVSVKMLTESGDIVIYELGEKVNIDGEVCDSKEALDLHDVLVSYTANEEGILKTIDTPCKPVIVQEGEETKTRYEGLGEDESYLNSFQMYYDGYEKGEELKYKSSSAMFEGKIALDTNNVVFVIPQGDDVSDRDYKVYTAKQYFTNDSKHTVKAYKMEDKKLTAIAALVYTKVTDANESVPGDTAPVFVEKATKVFDAEGYSTTKIVGYLGTSKMEFYLPDELGDVINHTIRGGDIIKISYNKENVIKGIEILYSYAQRSLIGANPNVEDLTAIFRVINANVYRKVDNMIVTTTQELVPGVSYEGKELEYEELHKVSAYKCILKYDERTETISRVGVNDLIAFENTGSVCSEVVIYDRYADPVYMYLFNK